MNFFRKPKYRIIQRGNGMFYAQERRFGTFWFEWTTLSAGPHSSQTSALREIEREQEYQQSLKDKSKIIKVIHI